MVTITLLLLLLKKKKEIMEIIFSFFIIFIDTFLITNKKENTFLIRIDSIDNEGAQVLQN